MENRFEKDLTGKISTQNYLCTITWRNGQLYMDEPEILGGQDLGPDPFSMLLASLAGCTLSTLRMYSNRKGWDIPEIQIALNLTQEMQETLVTTITRKISFPDAIPLEQKERLLVIAEKCPISKLLHGNTIINTTI